FCGVARAPQRSRYTIRCTHSTDRDERRALRRPAQPPPNASGRTHGPEPAFPAPDWRIRADPARRPATPPPPPSRSGHCAPPPAAGLSEPPNPALAAAPRTGEERGEASHEGESYFAARGAEAASRKAAALPPDLARLVAKAYAEKRLLARDAGPHPLASAGWR